MLHRPVNPAPNDPPRGCGWYDSSWELERGLRVTELAEPDQVAPLLPLNWWLAWELKRPAVAA